MELKYQKYCRLVAYCKKRRITFELYTYFGKTTPKFEHYQYVLLNVAEMR